MGFPGKKKHRAEPNSDSEDSENSESDSDSDEETDSDTDSDTSKKKKKSKHSKSPKKGKTRSAKKDKGTLESHLIQQLKALGYPPPVVQDKLVCDICGKSHPTTACWYNPTNRQRPVPPGRPFRPVLEVRQVMRVQQTG